MSRRLVYLLCVGVLLLGRSALAEPPAAREGAVARAGVAPGATAMPGADAPRPRARPPAGARENTLLDRPDEIRSAEGPQLTVFGRPLTLGSQYTARTRWEDERLAKDGDSVDYLRINQDLGLDLFYAWSEHVSAYVEGRFVNRNLVYSTNDGSDTSFDVKFSEGWLFLGNLLDSPLSLQVGRQRIFDEREWWWDDEFDAVRLHLDLDRVHAEASFADDVASVSTDFEDAKSEDQDIRRIFGRALFEWAPKQQVGLYGLHQIDHSAPHEPEQPVDGETEEDPSDGNLTWVGASALGRRTLGRFGGLAYWLDGAYVFGDETYYKFGGPTCCRTLRSVHEHSVGGWGIDFGATWELPLPAAPFLTLGYARGSGRSGMSEEEDRGFRQTGVENNNWKWRGAQSRFKYYGEILEPELSNLQVFTASLGLRVLRRSSVTLNYHFSRQVEAADYLRDANLSADPDGSHRSIGQEWNLILGIEEWRHVELELIGGIFRAGAAFGPDGSDPSKDRVKSQVGDLSYLVQFQLRVGF